VFNKLKALSATKEGDKADKNMLKFLEAQYEADFVSESVKDKTIPFALLQEMQNFAYLSSFFEHQLTFAKTNSKNNKKYWQTEQPFAGVFFPQGATDGSFDVFVIPTVTSLTQATRDKSLAKVVLESQNVFLESIYTDLYMATTLALHPKTFTEKNKSMYFLQSKKKISSPTTFNIVDTERFKNLYGEQPAIERASAKDRVLLTALAFANYMKEVEDESKVKDDYSFIANSHEFISTLLQVQIKEALVRQTSYLTQNSYRDLCGHDYLITHDEFHSDQVRDLKYKQMCLMVKTDGLT